VLHHIALVALTSVAAEVGAGSSPEAAWLEALAAQTQGASARQWLDAALQSQAPAGPDGELLVLAARLRLTPIETVACALAAAVELDPMLARVLAWLQAPAGGARPTLGLLGTVAEALALPSPLRSLVQGRAATSGLLQLEGGPRPLPEQSMAMPLPLVLALHGRLDGAPSTVAPWPGTHWLRADEESAAPSLLRMAALQARALTVPAAPAGDDLESSPPMLALRSGHQREARRAAALVAAALRCRALCVSAEWPAGLGPWLRLQCAVPVLALDLAPGESREVSLPPGYSGPLLVASGGEGCFVHQGDPVPDIVLPWPDVAERTLLWRRHVGAEDASALALAHRHMGAQIEHLARQARREAVLAGSAGSGAPTAAAVRQAIRDAGVGDLGTLAVRVPDTVDDDALVLSPTLRDGLHALLDRCRHREHLAARLGVAARTRYRSGVRALFVGASGTGKTLAAAWIATRLGLPLYRVDLASVSSKYIGETEKNLAQLFARAEQAEVVLLFDEADSLFGRRTDVKDSNDRFANQQTNYLLQRIESFDGLALLTSNSRSRFDAAFTRRLDAIVEFASPGPEERRALWVSHLGADHEVADAELNRIAALCDLAGGHIRNVVLAAAARKCERADVANPGRVDAEALLWATAAEYAKLGRPLPSGLRAAPATRPAT
jgi:hypothetical protein